MRAFEAFGAFAHRRSVGLQGVVQRSRVDFSRGSSRLWLTLATLEGESLSLRVGFADGGNDTEEGGSASDTRNGRDEDGTGVLADLVGSLSDFRRGASDDNARERSEKE